MSATIATPVVTFPEGQPAIFCRACGVFHEFSLTPNPHGDQWIWNGDLFKPTFHPTVMTKVISKRDQKQYICHAWVVDGMVTYLKESTHKLRMQTFKLEPPP